MAQEIPSKAGFLAFWMSLTFISESSYKSNQSSDVALFPQANGTGRESADGDGFMGKLFVTADLLLKCLGRRK